MPMWNSLNTPVSTSDYAPFELANCSTLDDRETSMKRVKVSKIRVRF